MVGNYYKGNYYRITIWWWAIIIGITRIITTRITIWWWAIITGITIWWWAIINWWTMI
jgi:hypothetical protein